jgi:hypothetical protein
MTKLELLKVLEESQKLGRETEAAFLASLEGIVKVVPKDVLPKRRVYRFKKVEPPGGLESTYSKSEIAKVVEKVATGKVKSKAAQKKTTGIKPLVFKRP